MVQLVLKQNPVWYSQLDGLREDPVGPSLHRGEIPAHFLQIQENGWFI